MKNCLYCHEWKADELFVKSNGKTMKWCADCRKRNGELSRAGNNPVIRGDDYDSRIRNLKVIGFATYAEYLASDLWKSIRVRVFASKGSTCVACPAFATQVHHNRYHKNDLLGKNLNFLVPICRTCHEVAEFDRGKKSTVRKARKAIRHMKRSKPVVERPKVRIVDFNSPVPIVERRD